MFALLQGTPVENSCICPKNELECILTQVYEKCTVHSKRKFKLTLIALGYTKCQCTSLVLLWYWCHIPVCGCLCLHMLR